MFYFENGIYFVMHVTESTIIFITMQSQDMCKQISPKLTLVKVKKTEAAKSIRDFFAPLMPGLDFADTWTPKSTPMSSILVLTPGVTWNNELSSFS